MKLRRSAASLGDCGRKNEERRTKNEERRTKNEERRTKNEERRTKCQVPSAQWLLRRKNTPALERRHGGTCRRELLHTAAFARHGARKDVPILRDIQRANEPAHTLHLRCRRPGLRVEHCVPRP